VRVRACGRGEGRVCLCDSSGRDGWAVPFIPLYTSTSNRCVCVCVCVCVEPHLRDASVSSTHDASCALVARPCACDTAM
jgi:hypothetical protein